MGKKRKAGGGFKRDYSEESKRRHVPQKLQWSGPGILLTTIRRKERKAGLELIEFLEDIVEELYPDLNLFEEEDITSVAAYRDDDDNDNDNDDDDLDALINGEPLIIQTRDERVVDSSKSNVKIDVAVEQSLDNDVEAQIQAELDELRPNKSKKQSSNIIVEKKDKEINSLWKKKKFSLIDPEVECLMFVSVAWPMDPVRLSCALLDRVAKTGQVRGHFIQRLSPIYLTARAEIDKIVELADTVMKRYFPESSEPVTFKVDVRARLHTQLDKMDVIRNVAKAVPIPHRANLTSPDYLINVEILRMTIGIGILPRFEQYRRYNPQMIAQNYNEQNSGKAEHTTSRTLMASAETVTL